jgi:pyrophosphatase PpaX
MRGSTRDNMDSAGLDPLADGVRHAAPAVWICDVNGVLLDSMPLIREAFAATAARYRFPFNDDRFREVAGLSLVDAYQVLDPGSDQRLRREFHVRYLRERIDGVAAFPDVAETLATAKAQDVRVGAATSCGEIAEACLVKTGLYPFIDCLVTQEEVRRYKPDPESIMRALALLGVHPSNVGSAVHIGDSPLDVEAGRAAGVRTVGVTYGVSNAAEMAAVKPDCVMHSFGDMRWFLPGAAGIAPPPSSAHAYSARAAQL